MSKSQRSWVFIPKIRYDNLKKEFPTMQSKGRWGIVRYWGGKLINICFGHRQIVLDFRRDWVADMLKEEAP